MKTLRNQTILYDDECPMCTLYAKSFVSTGMLDKEGRQPYTECVNKAVANIDWNRARNEIALIDKETQHVKYGVDSIITIIGNSFPGLEKFFRLRPVFFLAQRLYFLISYNRKVMAPGKVFEGANTRTPDMNVRYRWAYIVFAWMLTSLILVYYFRLGAPLVPESGFLREVLVCAGQLVFQGVVVAMFRRDRVIHYLGNVMTVSLAGALALSPMFLLAGFVKSNLFYIAYFFMVVTLMFFEHMRRVKILELPFFVSVSWVLYRFLILFFVIL